MRESNPAFQIREATVDDTEAIRRMHAQSWRDTYPNEAAGVSREWVEEETGSWLTPEALRNSRQYFSDKFDNPDHFYRIALDGDKVVGLVHGVNQDGHRNLAALYVDKNYQGTGLAYRLMDAVNEWFGDNEVDLEVITYNRRAIRFYEKCGFKPGKENELFKGKLPNITMVREAKK